MIPSLRRDTEVLAASPPAGLSEDEVRARREHGETNAVALPTSRSYRQILRANLFTMVNGVLVVLGVALVVLGQASDAVFTAGIVLVNAAINVGQEIRAKRLLDRIALLVRPRATVIREGQARDVAAGEVVRGDLLLVRTGDQIVADGRVVGAGRVEVAESLLTGESEPVSKRAGDPLLSGSFCVGGTARYVAEGVGAASYANTLAAGARAFRQTRTPLQAEIDVFVRVMVLVVAFLGLVCALAAQFTQLPVVRGVQIAAVIAGLVPNGLILMLSIAYATGAVRMAWRGVLIQQTNAMESLANVDILCLDKTGTLTTNRLVLQATHAIDTTPDALARRLAAYAAATTTRNPTVEAIAAHFAGGGEAARAEVPFTSARKWGALRFADGWYVLGAPELVLPDFDTHATPLPGWIAAGLRVLVVAHAPGTAALDLAADTPRLPGPLRPLGLLALRDELRPEAAAALRGFQEAGIRLKIISGDHPETVHALAVQAGLGAGLARTSGVALAGMDAAQLATVAEEATIFGRITPAQKEQLVAALRAGGHYVAMIGDGANDVLSLKQAQLGIAMQGGTAATRAVADLVLLDDSFAALPRAFAEGQRILNGMRDCLALYLTRLAYVTLSIVAVGLVANDFPFTPKSASLLALVTIGVPTYAVVTWARPGGLPRGSMFRSLGAAVVSAALLIALLGLGVYGAFFADAIAPQRGAGLAGEAASGLQASARSGLVTALALSGIGLIALLPALRGAGGRGRRGVEVLRGAALAAAMLAVYLVVLATPPLRAFFDLAPLAPRALGGIVVATTVGTLLLWGAWRARLLARFLASG